MRIRALIGRPRPGLPRSIEAWLQDVIDSGDKVRSLRCKKLLELVHALVADESPREATGMLLFDKLLLSPAGRRREVIVELEADWQDYGPVRDSEPVMHYRVRAKRRGKKLSEEIRVTDAEEVRKFIHETFEWNRE